LTPRRKVGGRSPGLLQACQLHARVRLAPVSLGQRARQAQGGCVMARAEDADARAGPSAGERLPLPRRRTKVLPGTHPKAASVSPPNGLAMSCKARLVDLTLSYRWAALCQLHGAVRRQLIGGHLPP
jgi:hypothetical protein